MRFTSTIILLGCAIAPYVNAQNNSTPSLFVGYSLQRVNAGPGQCGCFFLNGGEAELALGTTHSMGAVADFSGHTNSNAGDSGSGLSLLTLAVGPRLYIGSSHHAGSRHFVPFTEALVGASHGFNSFFPVSGGATSATAFALVAGGGLDVRLSHRVAVRPAQVDYIFTDFANGTNNHQNSLRISAGVVLKLR